MFKYAKFAKEADNALRFKNEELKATDSILNALSNKIESFKRENTALKEQNELKELRLQNATTTRILLQENFENALKSEKGKKWTWGSIGALLGSILTLITVLNI